MEPIVAANTAPPSTEEPGPRSETKAWGELTLVIEYKKGDTKPVGDGYDVMYLVADYGYVDGTVSMEEGDALDIFLNPESETSFGTVFVVGMLEGGLYEGGGGLEEEKCFLNYPNQKSVEEAFDNQYSSSKRGYMYSMTDADFTKMAKMRTVAAQKMKEVDTQVFTVQAPSDGDGIEEVLGQKSLIRGSMVMLAKQIPNIPAEHMQLLFSLRKRQGLAAEIEISQEEDLKKSLLHPMDKDGTMKPLALLAKSRGYKGSGHIPGEAFSREKTSDLEREILALLSKGVDLSLLCKAVGLELASTRRLLRGWGVLGKADNV